MRNKKKQSKRKVTDMAIGAAQSADNRTNETLSNDVWIVRDGRRINLSEKLRNGSKG